MNRTGISKVYFIKRSLCNFPGYHVSGSIIDLTPYLAGPLTELDFDTDTISLTEDPGNTNGNRFKKVAASFTISGIDNDKHTLLSLLSDEPHIFVFGDNEGQYFLCGTTQYRAEFHYKFSHISPPNSAKNYKVQIVHNSPHGLIFCSIPA